MPCYNTLTGFKYIASIIKSLEGSKTFLVGGEESYGYLIGDFVRDKDAVASCVMIAEMCAYAKDQGLTLFDMLIDMYTQFGFYKEALISITKKGMKGAEEIQQMMANFRENPPSSFAGSEVVRAIDYKLSLSKDLRNATSESIEYEKSNVLQFFTGDGYKISARPSGTEPKIKFYISVNAPLDRREDYDKISNQLDVIIEQIKGELN